jgi:hypothetical protein
MIRNKIIRKSFKRLLTAIGARLPAARLHGIQMIVNYMKLGRFMSDHFQIERRVLTTSSVFAAVARRIGDRPVLYLEFGVFKGRSIRFWSEALKHPDSRFHGFDTFEGLPEDFDVGGRYVRGTFDAEGKVPSIDDPRVQFFKGRFEVVLPNYQLPPHELLVIVLDADLYTSTIYVLRHLRPFIKPGTLVYFDDLSRPDHEPRAFLEFMNESGLKFRPLIADFSLNNVFFECMEENPDVTGPESPSAGVS